MAEIDLSPGELDFVGVPRGDSIYGTWTIKEAGVAVDVSDWTWLSQVRASPDDADPVLMTFTIGDDDAATGLLTLSLAASAWTGAADALPLPDPAVFYWDLQGTNTVTDEVRTFVAGRIKLKADVSRA